MSTELGQRVGYRVQTVNYGEYVLEADARTASGDLGIGASSLGITTRRTSGRFVVRNLGFPLTPAIFADSAVGDVSTEITNALGRTYKLSLGSSTVRGASVRVAGPDFDVRAGTGLRGQLAGGPFPGFEPSSGETSWLGYSRRFGDRASAGIQIDRSTQTRTTLFPLGPSGTPAAGEDVTSLAASGTYVWTLADGQSIRGRFVGMANRSSQAPGANGLFVEGTYVGVGQRQEFGAYRADPNLRFADAFVTTGTNGAYWRIDAVRPRLAWGAGIDAENQAGIGAGALDSRRISLSGNGSWRLDRYSSVNAAANVVQTRFSGSAATGLTGDTRSVYLNADYRTRFLPWGTTAIRLTLRRNEALVSNGVAATGEEIEWEQDWIQGAYETQAPEFRTTLGIARDRSTAQTEIQPTAGLVFRFWPDAEWNVGGSLQYTARNGNLSTSRGLSGTLDTERVFAGGWRVGASLQMNQATVRLAPGGLELLPEVNRTNDKYLQVYVRWEGSAGTSARGLGAGESRSGAGSVEGVVFFDANRDGEQQPGENGVPEVEVFLDGRYRARTDRNGHFSYPLVATGAHTITLTPESVPLPWGVANEKGVRIEVPLRGQSNPRIPVTKVGE
jgi:hypothetical protein